jgi:hypothetical protein
MSPTRLGGDIMFLPKIIVPSYVSVFLTSYKTIYSMTLLHIGKIVMTTCDESTLSSQNSREKVRFFNLV